MIRLHGRFPRFHPFEIRLKCVGPPSAESRLRETRQQIQVAAGAKPAPEKVRTKLEQTRVKVKPSPLR
jgi:hypothetical protein